MVLPALKQTCRVFIIVLISLVTIELCARIDDSLSYGAPFFSKYTANRLKGSDGGISHNIPNARFEKWHNNNLGFRGPDIELIKSKEIQRIVCLGASESYGLYESLGKEWPAQLRSLLPESSFEVINASVAGISMPQYQSYLNKYVFPLNPDKVIFVINPFFLANIFERDKRAGGATVQIPSTQKKITHEKPKLIESGFQWRSRYRIKQATKKVLIENFPSFLLAYQLKNLGKQIKLAEKRELNGRKPIDRVSDEALENYREDLTALVNHTKSQGIKVVLTTYPALISATNIDQYPELFLDHRRFCIAFSFTGMVNILDRYNKSTLALATEQKLEVLDIAAVIPKDLDFFGDNVHYTDQGAAIIAKLLAEKLSVPNRFEPQPEETILRVVN